MAQVTSGLRALLSRPDLYNIFQNFMGARVIRQAFVLDFVRPKQKCAILDLGCGPAEILDYLPEVDYWGFDINASYIRQARERFGEKGHFYCTELTEATLIDLPAFDIVLAMGVLHHLDDSHAGNMLRLAHDALRKGGRFVSFDPCLVDKQNLLARCLVKYDRGQNIRQPEQYRHLAQQVFTNVRSEIRHQAFIPYTRFMMECNSK